MSQEHKLALREWARVNDRNLFVQIQKRGAYKDFWHLFDKSHPDYGKRFKEFKGGRGAGRTTTIARCLVDRMADSYLRVCAARSFQNSIAESNMQAIVEQISALGLEHRFKITDKYVESDKGAVCIFRGLERNTQSIKSLQSIDILWIEEAAGLSQKTLDIVEPTIRKDTAEIWLSWNPEGLDSPVESIEKTYGNRVCVRHTNYVDNPWCPQTIRLSAAALKERDYERYLHVYEGAFWSQSEASILGRKLVSYNFEVDESYGTPHIGIDWGFSKDPTAVTEAYVCGSTLFIRRAAGKVRLELDDTAEWLKAKVPLINQYASYADSARPETISKIAKTIPLIKSVAKWAGSVEEGVNYLQSFKEIVVHPECQHDTLSELRNYRFKIDNNDNVTRIILDENNHYSDALRYSLSSKIKTGNTFGFLDLAEEELRRIGK